MKDWIKYFVATPIPPHIWLGISASNQADADRWIPTLLQIPAAKRFVSYEPALGPVDFNKWIKCGGLRPALDESGYNMSRGKKPFSMLDLIVAGGESGPGARPSHPDWFRKVRDDCDAAGTPFNFKQWGEWGLPGHGNSGNFANVIPDGHYAESKTMPRIFQLYGNALMRKVGKKAAGRELDGQIWDQWPENP